MAHPSSNLPRRTLLLTGASRGIGHATVKRFSAAGWRVITCSRHPFPENCPWEAGPEDHIQVDLADPEDTLARHQRDQAAHPWRTPCARQQRRNFTEAGVRRAARNHQYGLFGLAAGVPGQLLRADHARPRPRRRIGGGQGIGGERHLDRRVAGASLCRFRLLHLEGGARLAHPRDGQRFRPARHPRQRHRARRDRHSDPVAGHREDHRPNSAPAGSAPPTRSPRSSTCCARRPRPTSTAPRSTSMAGSMCNAGPRG